MSGCKGLREEGRGGTGEGGRNGDAWGGLHGVTETGRETTARERTTKEAGCGHRRHDDQVRSNGDRGERHGAWQGDRYSSNKEWSVGSISDSDEETEEDEMPAGELEGSDNTLTAFPWGTQENGAGGLRVDARAGGSNKRKTPSAPADEAGTRGRHGAWQEQRAKNGGR